MSATIYDIPGVIEAEWFDQGVQGVAYSDTSTGNYGDDVRDETFVVIRPFDPTTQVKNIGTFSVGR